MERGNYFASSSIPDRPERKVIEKNRRNKMKFLYFQLFSLLPENVVSKIAAAEIYGRLNEIFGGSSIKEVPGVQAPPANEEDANFDLWDFEISSDVWFKSS
ncbi:hypothetical protein L2E82_10626 [Cichorium intybus]|uniref:Uncharacterized protein n=1 Tax=Cichorium intybus TaxID=13427 RepID=A0ACB9GCB1_CICIN|nr:hypothetical protein L2E82_10626 [Cichorium intybus]